MSEISYLWIFKVKVIVEIFLHRLGGQDLDLPAVKIW